MLTFEAPQELAATVASIPNNSFQDLINPESHFFVDVHLVDEDQMRQLNRDARQKDEPTDVLSFPLYDSIDDLPAHDAPLGDLFICLSQVDEDHLGLRECLVHGTLHLLGFDHESNQTAWDAARAKVK